MPTRDAVVRNNVVIIIINSRGKKLWKKNLKKRKYLYVRYADRHRLLFIAFDGIGFTADFSCPRIAQRERLHAAMAGPGIFIVRFHLCCDRL